MRKAILLTTFFLGLFAFQSAYACTVSCTHGSCSGLLSCTCNTTGHPVCKDKEEIGIESIADLSDLQLQGMIDFVSTEVSSLELTNSLYNLKSVKDGESLNDYKVAIEQVNQSVEKLSVEDQAVFQIIIEQFATKGPLESYTEQDLKF